MDPARSSPMEPAIVPKSFGCLPQKSLMLRLNSIRSKGSAGSLPSSPRSTLQSPRSPSESLRSKRNKDSPSPRSSSLGESVTPKKNKEREFREVFARFDGDNDGKISALELRSYFGSIGDYMSHQEAQAVIDDLDTDGDGLIDFRDFLSLMRVNREEEEKEDVKAAFEMFEFEKGSGRISAKSLQRTLSRLGESRSYDECLKMIKVLDTHDKGAVDFNEFQRMMMA